MSYALVWLLIAAVLPNKPDRTGIRHELDYKLTY